jgi:hypothetical protein
MHKKFILTLCGIAVSFVVLMLLFREMMYVNIAITVIYIYLIFLLVYKRGKTSA